MFQRLLIANRGEIACRVMATARRLGMHTIGVFSEADREARHVRLADEARLIGPAPASESYLSIEAVIEAARASAAEAIHPGYGFLSENADFAEACAAAGIAFVGPPAEAIRAMGSKSRAKAIMGEAGVPLVPGYHGEEQEAEHLAAEAARIGFPVLIKASAGGGGKGMRAVARAADFAEALAGAKREAAGAFGEDRVLIEKLLAQPRHIEMQVFADDHGHALHLFERDCSLQRRHQKVIEEAPAPGMTTERRAEMGAAAVAAARAIDYRGAGTVEFIAEGDAFYFMEMNTRLQVEHPVTEAITGQDLVEWQLRVAAGEALPVTQEELSITGHAIEARLYAEDPARDFLPATGRLQHLHFPEAQAGLRVDAGVDQGDEVTRHYDPMIAKLIAWGEDREAARRRLVAALRESEVAGLVTNAGFLAALADHPAFAAAELDTGFIERHRATLLAPAEAVSASALAVAALDELLHRAEAAAERAARSADPWSPWTRTDGWRLNMETRVVLPFRDGESERAVTLHYRGGRLGLEIDGQEQPAWAERVADGGLQVELGERRFLARVVRQGPELTIFLDGRSERVSLIDPLAAAGEEEAGAGSLTAPMPGKVTALLVEPGARVARGAGLIVLEAMKMEHTIVAPLDGVVRDIHFMAGDLVDEGVELIAFEPAEAG